MRMIFSVPVPKPQPQPEFQRTIQHNKRPNLYDQSTTFNSNAHLTHLHRAPLLDSNLRWYKLNNDSLVISNSFTNMFARLQTSGRCSRCGR
jgi:hypothetical protein